MLFGVASSQVMAGVQTSFQYYLANFSGPLPYNWAKIHFAEGRNEIIAIDTRNNDIRIFDRNGMEVYRFGDDGSLGTITDAVIKSNGEVLVLSKSSRKTSIIQCNFRGEPVSELSLEGFPADYSGFSPDRLAYRNEKLYLLDDLNLRLTQTDSDGRFEKEYDIAEFITIEDDKRAETGIGGFSIDGEGNIFFTVPVLFSAYRLSPEGKLDGFGRPGSAPGRFGIVSSIVADDKGYIYVADQLRCAVMVYDRNLQFQKEFGYRGLKPENLIGPKYLTLDDQNRIYVSQLRNRGVSVFKITYN